MWTVDGGADAGTGAGVSAERTAGGFDTDIAVVVAVAAAAVAALGKTLREIAMASNSRVDWLVEDRNCAYFLKWNRAENLWQ